MKQKITKLIKAIAVIVVKELIREILKLAVEFLLRLLGIEISP